MRNPDRIPLILETIYEIWIENPDLRLMQLLGNCFSPADNYHREDDVLLERLRQVYGKSSERSTREESPNTAEQDAG